MPILVLEHDNKQPPHIQANKIPSSSTIGHYANFDPANSKARADPMPRHKYEKRRVVLPVDEPSHSWGVRLAPVAKMHTPHLSLGLAILSLPQTTKEYNRNDLKEGDVIIQIDQVKLKNRHVKELKDLFWNAKLRSDCKCTLIVLRVNPDYNTGSSNSDAEVEANGLSGSNNLDDVLKSSNESIMNEKENVAKSKLNEDTIQQNHSLDSSHDDDVSSVTNPSLKVIPIHKSVNTNSSNESNHEKNKIAEERNYINEDTKKDTKQADVLSIVKRQSIHSKHAYEHMKPNKRRKPVIESRYKANVESLCDKLLAGSGNEIDDILPVSSLRTKSNVKKEHVQSTRENKTRSSSPAPKKRGRKRKLLETVVPDDRKKRRAEKESKQKSDKLRSAIVDPARELVTDRDRSRISSYLAYLMSQFLRYNSSQSGGNGNDSSSYSGVFDNRNYLARISCRHCEASSKPFIFAPSSSRILGSRFKKLAFEHLSKCHSCSSKVRGELNRLESLQTQDWVNCKPNAEFSFYDRVWARINNLEEPDYESSSSESDDEDDN